MTQAVAAADPQEAPPGLSRRGNVGVWVIVPDPDAYAFRPAPWLSRLLVGQVVEQARQRADEVVVAPGVLDPTGIAREVALGEAVGAVSPEVGAEGSDAAGEVRVTVLYDTVLVTLDTVAAMVSALEASARQVQREHGLGGGILLHDREDRVAGWCGTRPYAVHDALPEADTAWWGRRTASIDLRRVVDAQTESAVVDALVERAWGERDEARPLHPTPAAVKRELPQRPASSDVRPSWLGKWRRSQVGKLVMRPRAIEQTALAAVVCVAVAAVLVSLGEAPARALGVLAYTAGLECDALARVARALWVASGGDAARAAGDLTNGTDFEGDGAKRIVPTVSPTVSSAPSPARRWLELREVGDLTLTLGLTCRVVLSVEEPLWALSCAVLGAVGVVLETGRIAAIPAQRSGSGRTRRGSWRIGPPVALRLGSRTFAAWWARVRATAPIDAMPWRGLGLLLAASFESALPLWAILVSLAWGRSLDRLGRVPSSQPRP